MPGMKFIAQADLAAWLAELASSMRLVAPRNEGGTVVYREYDATKGIELAKRPTESAKHALFPRSEELFAFAYKRPPFTAAGNGGDGEAGPGVSPELAVTLPEEPEQTVIFGMPGCDANGVGTFDLIYGEGKYKDTYYLKKREAAVFIVRACGEALSTCFCAWVGGGPADRRNGDILMTEVSGGWLLEPLTGRAGKVMGSPLLKDAEKTMEKEAEERHDAARRSLGAPPALEGIDGALFKLFTDESFWRDASAGCLACGACTYLCPTCHCFSITDEAVGKSGVRLRSWDTCMAPLYTMEASGHNPRAGKAARLKNRVGHKFAYFLRNNDGRISCCGCGRCIASCPSGVDIRRIVKDALASAGGTKEKAHG